MNRTLKNFSNSSENLDSQLRNCLLDPVGKIQIYFRCFYSTLIKKQVYHKVIALFSLEQVCVVLIMLILQLPIFEMAGRSRTRFINLAL